MSTEVPMITSQELMRPIATPKQLIQYHEDLTKIIRESLKEGVDYGVIPGTKKPSLYKAGAERINIAFGTHAEYFLIKEEVDHNRINEYEKYGKIEESYGLYRYIYKCKIVKYEILFANNGSQVLIPKVIGEGEGICSTMESKYISRPRDSENTVCKMAQKRSFTAATLHAFGLSDRFTHDVEDFHTIESEEGKDQGEKSKKPTNNFNANDAKHVEWAKKKLTEKKVNGDHQGIIEAFHGKAFNQKTLEDVIYQKTVVDNTFAG